MKHFSAIANHMSVTRKDGFYMSNKVATLVVRKLTPVLQLCGLQVQTAVSYLSNGDLHDEQPAWDLPGFTPAESVVLRNLSCWYSYEYTEGYTPDTGAAFLAVNLNTGSCLVISSRKERMGSREIVRSPA